MRWPCFSVVAAIIVMTFCHFDISLAQELPKPLAEVAAASDSVRLIPQKKSPTGAMLRSLILPGWGQFYNGQYLKGALAIGAETGFITAAIYWNQRQVGEPPNSEAQLLYKDYRNQMIWWLGGTILLSMLDAYVDAHLSDFDESPDLSMAPPNFLANGAPALKIQFKIKL